MTRLAQTADLTDVQTEILATVRSFVDEEIIPNAQELEHGDVYPTEIVEGLKEMGIFGLVIDEASRKMALVIAGKGRAAGLTRTSAFTPPE